MSIGILLIVFPDDTSKIRSERRMGMRSSNSALRVYVLLLSMLVGTLVMVAGGRDYLKAEFYPDPAVSAEASWAAPEYVWTPGKKQYLMNRYALAEEWVHSLGFVAPKAHAVTADTVACGKQMGVNARYCSVVHETYFTIEYIEQFANTQSEKFGLDALIGHEVAHGIQYAINSRPDKGEGGAFEYQADCGSGVYVRWLSDNGHINVNQFDIDLYQNRFIRLVTDGHEVGDKRYGLNLRRMQWFSEGYNSGDIATCSFPDFGLPMFAQN